MEDNIINLNKSTQLDMGTNSVSYSAIGTSSGQTTANSLTSALYYPYYPYTYTTPNYNYKDIIVRKVENGWIVVKLGKEYICTTDKDLAKLITKEEK